MEISVMAKSFLFQATLVLALPVYLNCHLVLAGYRAPPSDDRHIDLALNTGLLENRRTLGVEFYYRNAEPSGTGQPPLYVRGVRVTEPNKATPRLGQWESEPTSINTFYPNLNKLWQVPGGSLLTTAVQYGGRSLRLHVLKWQRGGLRQVGVWEGENFSIRQMGEHQQLVITVKPPDYNQLPQLYVWNRDTFRRADRDFPDFFSQLGDSYAQAIRSSRLLPAVAIVQSCRLSLEAYQLSRTPSRGRNACTAAKERIVHGRALAASASPQQFEQEKKSAIVEIDNLLARFTPTQEKKDTHDSP